MSENYITEPLNAEQLAAVTAPASHQLVLAGAGTGKTLVLTSRFAWLVREKGCSPYSIMAVTFTNRAAAEMRQRIERLLNQPMRGLWIGTFHSIALRMLRYHRVEAALSPDFRIIDSDEQKRLIKRLLKELDIDEKEWPPKALADFISRQKENRRRAEDIETGEQPDGTYVNDIQATLYRAYQAACENDGLVDFSEMLLRGYEMLAKNASLLEDYRQRFTHLLVDEFQDTNNLQYQWLKLLVGEQNHMMAVGDDDQSIYSWRGARVENMEDFRRHFKDVHLVRLEQNYRSTGNILAAANAVIKHNHTRIGKELRTSEAHGELISCYGAANADEEASFILEQVVEWQVQGRRLAEAAILYRSHAQSRILELTCLARNVPYRIFGGMPFYSRAEVRHALAYMRLLVQPDANEALERVINFPTRGIGGKTLSQLRSYAKEAQLSLWQACTESAMQAAHLSARSMIAITAFRKLILALQEDIRDLPLGLVATLVLERTGLLEYYSKEGGESGQARVENMEELVSACDAYEGSDMVSDTIETSPPNVHNSLYLFLDDITLGIDAAAADENRDALCLMTLHSAKGLEFPLVFMAGMENGLFPHYMATEEEGREEEERRLCYVGITRARERLCMTYAHERQIWGSTHYNRPSAFLREIPPQLLEPLTGNPFDALPLSEMESEIEPGMESEMGLGMEAAPQAGAGSIANRRVFHEDFGEGVVLMVKGEGAQTKAQVQFENAGRKWLMLEYANLELL